jgi:tetratricopeptide (TPR) repeat protein
MSATTRLLVVSVVVLVACSWHHSRRPEAEAAACSPAAQAAFDGGQLATARRGFEADLAAAERARDRRREDACTFYLGLVAQTEAGLENGRQRDERLAEAVRWYEAARPRARGAPGRIVNLARAYVDLGEPSRADALFDAALARARGDTRAALARSYAQLLGPRQWDRSAGLYREVLAAAPTDDESRVALLSLLAAHAPQDLPAAVWDAIDAGRVLLAQHAALDGIERNQTSDPLRVELLAGLVAALSRQHYDAGTFHGSEVGNALRRLTAEPQLGEGAREVLVAHSATMPEAQDFRWWDRSAVPYNRSPLFAFRSLLRSLASHGDHGDLRRAAGYLKAATKLGAETPDPQLWIEVASNQLARGDLDTLDQNLERWNLLLRQSGTSVARDDLTVYRQAIGDVHRRVAMLRAQGYSSGVNGVYTVDRGCIAGPGNCSLEVRSRLPAPGLPPRSEVVASMVRQQGPLAIGCGERQGEVPRGEPGPTSRSAVRPARFVAASLEPADPPPHAALLASFVPAGRAWQRIALVKQPAWLSSAAWRDDAELCLADSLYGQLLEIGTDGAPRAAVPTPLPAGDDLVLRVQRSPGGELVAEEASGRLVLGIGSAQASAVQLVGRTIARAKVMSVVQWAPLGERSILAIANLLGNDGMWRSAIVRVTGRDEQVDVVHTIDVAGPGSDLYRVGIPALAASGNVAYFLALEEDPISLYEVHPGAPARRLSRLPALPGGFRAQLHREMTRERTADLFRLLATTSLTAGLFTQGEGLFLLNRLVAGGPGRVHWELVRLDPRDGRALGRASLPSAAPHLTVAPGDRWWAFFEKGPVEGFGRQAVRSMLLVSSQALRSDVPGSTPTSAKRLGPGSGERTR